MALQPFASRCLLCSQMMDIWRHSPIVHQMKQFYQTLNRGQAIEMQCVECAILYAGVASHGPVHTDFLSPGWS